MSERGYGYYPEEGGLYTAGLLTGGGLKYFKAEGKRYPSMTWGIKKIINMERMKKIREKEEEKERKGKKTWRQVFNKYVIPVIKQAKEEYERNLTGPELEAYRKREQERLKRKEREKENIELIENILDELKGNNPQQAALNLAKVLIYEGNPDDRIFRAIMGYLYPQLKTKISERTGKPVLESVEISKDLVPKRRQGSYIRLLELLLRVRQEIREQRRNITNRPPREERREQFQELVPEEETDEEGYKTAEETDEEGYKTAEEEEVKEPKEQLQGAGIRARKTKRNRRKKIIKNPIIKIKGLEELRSIA